MVALLVESWIWYAVVMIVAISRFISRWMTLGTWKKFQSDDYLMVVILCFYTTLISTINIVRNTSSNLLPPGFDIQNITPEEKHDRQYGSKLILVVEQCQCVTIWGAKMCLILLYLRITTVHRENLAIKILAAYVVVTFVVMDILYFGVWCQPFHNYWAVPTPNPQCDAATNHLITNAVFNLTSDCAMLIVGLPMFLRMHLPWKKKWPVVGIFSLGVFTILAAVLNKVYSFSQPFGAEWTYWYTRESSTALLVANLPFVWTLWKRVTGVKSLTGESKNSRRGTGDGDASPGEGKRKLSGTVRNSSDLELAEGVGVDLSLEDMLGEENPASKSEKAPTPFTHPHLFYSRKQSNGLGRPDAAILTEKPEQDTVRRSSDPHDWPENSPESSKFPSVASKRSAGSFV